MGGFGQRRKIPKCGISKIAGQTIHADKKRIQSLIGQLRYIRIFKNQLIGQNLHRAVPAVIDDQAAGIDMGLGLLQQNMDRWWHMMMRMRMIRHGDTFRVRCEMIPAALHTDAAATWIHTPSPRDG